MNKILFICLLLFAACDDDPRYKFEVLTNDYKDTLYVVTQWTTSIVYVTDEFWYEKIYETKDKNDAWTFYKTKMKEYEDWKKEQHK